MASRPFQFLEKKRSKIRKRAAKHFAGLAALSTHSAGRWAAVKAGYKPVHFSIDGCPLSCYFSGSVATLRDTLSTSRSVGRGTGAFIYALSADETSPALAASRHAITALFSCCFKRPCPPRRQRHFHGNADRAYNTLHFVSKVVCQMGALPPLETPTRKGGTLPLHGAHTAFPCYPALRLYRLSKSLRGLVWYLYLSETPVSHLDTVLAETFNVSASCACVIPFSLRSSFKKFPIFI